MRSTGHEAHREPAATSAFHTFSVGLAAGRAGGPMSAAVSAREHRSRSTGRARSVGRAHTARPPSDVPRLPRVGAARDHASPVPPAVGPSSSSRRQQQRGKPSDAVIMEKLREQYGPHMTNDMIIMGLRREIKRLEKLLTQVLSLEQQADARANASDAALKQQGKQLKQTEAKLAEAEYALEQKDLELADRDSQLAALAELRCLPAESASSLTAEIASLRLQLANTREQNHNLAEQLANSKRQLVIARFKMAG